MKIKLNQDQGYITIYGAIKYGKKNEIVNVEPTFVKFIHGKYELVSDKPEEPKKVEETKANKKTSK